MITGMVEQFSKFGGGGGVWLVTWSGWLKRLFSYKSIFWEKIRDKSQLRQGGGGQSQLAYKIADH